MFTDKQRQTLYAALFCAASALTGFVFGTNLEKDIRSALTGEVQQLRSKAFVHDKFMELGLYDQPEAYCKAYARFKDLYDEFGAEGVQ